MIFDSFIFFNENDVAAIRFEELYPVVDMFVVVQSNKTFRNNPKPDYFDYKRFEKYMDKIKIVNLIDEVTTDPWQREFNQRDAIKSILETMARPDDIVILSDADEIPRRHAIHYIDLRGIVALKLDRFSYGINMKAEDNQTIKVLRMRDFTMSAQQLRFTDPQVTIDHAGWEFSSLGSAEDIAYKLKNFAHSEFSGPEHTNIDVLQGRMNRREDIVGRPGIKHTIVPIDDTWPEAIKNDREYWSKYEWPI